MSSTNASATCTPGVEPDRDHVGDVGVGLLERDAGLEPRHSLKAEITEKELVAVEALGDDQFRLRIQEAKILRHHSDDGARAGIESERAADHRLVSGKLTL